MKILDIITEQSMTQAQFDAYFAAWRKSNPEAVAKLISADPLAGAGPLGGKSPAAQKLLRTAIGIAPLVQLNLNLYALNQVAAQDLVTFRASSPEFANYTQADKDQYINQMRDMYYGVWFTAFLVPALAGWLVRGTPVVSSLFEMLENYIGRIPGRAGGFVNLAKQLTIPLFVGWLQSSEGIRWLGGTIFMPIIRTAGTGVVFTWDKIWPKIQEWTGLPLDKINQDTQNAVDADGKALSGMKFMNPYEFAKKEQDLTARMNARNKQYGGGIVPGRD
jgi:hypothetical protein